VRLPRVDTGHSRGTRIQFGVLRTLFRLEPPDVVKMLFYRPDFFGKHLNRLSHAVMRGASEWKVWERELFAAHVSRLHQCPF
jgi:hypothetical protein